MGSVVPTHVGVNRVLRQAAGGCWGRPHARGGEPGQGHDHSDTDGSSPRTWG